MYRACSLVLVGLFAVAGSTVPSASAADPRPDFSGTWVLDTQRSWLAAPDREALPAETLVVKQTATTLTLDGELVRNVRTKSVPLDRPVDVLLDGKTYEVQASWTHDWLIITTALSRPDAMRVTTLAWRLSGDGKELTITGARSDSDRSRPNEVASSEVKTTRVYRKQD